MFNIVLYTLIDDVGK